MNGPQEVLEVRTENLKEGKSRQDMFAAQGRSNSVDILDLG